MKVKEILSEALTILGFAYSDMMNSAPFSNDCLSLVNLALADIGKARQGGLESSLDLSEKEREVLIYGVARAITLYLGDNVKNAPVTDIYNAKRRSLLSSVGKIKEVRF